VTLHRGFASGALTMARAPGTGFATPLVASTLNRLPSAALRKVTVEPPSRTLAGRGTMAA
jgi:hypothetical protein